MLLETKPNLAFYSFIIIQFLKLFENLCSVLNFIMNRILGLKVLYVLNYNIIQIRVYFINFQSTS